MRLAEEFRFKSNRIDSSIPEVWLNRNRNAGKVRLFVMSERKYLKVEGDK